MTYGLVKNLVNGEFRAATSGGTIEVYNPADGQAIGAVPAMQEEDLDEVFKAAAHGESSWCNIGPIARGQVLIRASRIIEERSDELTDLIVTELGKTRPEAAGEVQKAAEFFQFFGNMGRSAFGEYLPDARPNTFASKLREPLGSVLLITPWNDPLLTPARKMAPALIAGNAVVIKPATHTPMIALRLAEILHEAGLPAGALGTVTGRIGDIGERLTENHTIRAVSFTGSTHVGLNLQRKLAGGGVRLQTEMGGKNAVLVLDDADLDLAVEAIISGAFAQAGQRCTATSRIVAQAGIASDLERKLVDRIRRMRVGPGDSEGSDVGPVVSIEAQKEITQDYERALTEGAELLAAAELDPNLPSSGCFVPPTLVRSSTDNRIWSKEVFGPVLVLTVVQSLKEGIDAVNDSSYGLSSAVFTRDLSAAYTFVNQVDTGQLSVNQPTTGWDIHHPFGGFKDSGSPFKEQGEEALNFYTRVKTVAINTGQPPQ